MRVFLSSNHADLVPEREIVRSVVRDFDHEPVEAPSDGASWERVSELIADSDILILLLGKSLGPATFPGGHPAIMSEYALAKELGKPTYALIFNNDCLSMDPEGCLAGQKESERKRWMAFRSQLESEVYADIERPGDVEHVLAIVLGEMEADACHRHDSSLGSSEILEETSEQDPEHSRHVRFVEDVHSSAPPDLDTSGQEVWEVDGPTGPTDPSGELVTIYAGDQVDATDIADLLLVVSKAFEAIGGEPLVVREGGSGRFRSTVAI